MASITTDSPQKPADERVLRESRFKKLLRRPELGAISGALLVFVFFSIVAGNQGFLTLRGAANYLEVSAELGILAVAVSLLMIGGEFDLSIGSMIGATGMITAILSAELGWNIWPAMLVSLLIALAIGALNGILVIRTRLPSFIITLGTLFIVRGGTIGLTRLITGRTQVGGLKDVVGYDSAAAFFASNIGIPDPTSARGLNADFPISIIWWLVIAAIATYILLRTDIGNWIFGIGGDEQAARNVGVPVNRLKIALFMATAAAA